MKFVREGRVGKDIPQSLASMVLNHVGPAGPIVVILSFLIVGLPESQQRELADILHFVEVPE